MAYQFNHIQAFYQNLAVKAKADKSVFTEWNYLDKAGWYGMASNLKGK